MYFNFPPIVLARVQTQSQSRLEDVAGVGVGKNIMTPTRTHILSVIVIRLLKSLNAYYGAYV